MEDFNDVFNLNPEDYIEKNEKTESDFFKPGAKKGTENVYKSLIRFIPFWEDPKNSKIKKYTYWLTDPYTDEGFTVDCPSTINEKSIIQDTFFKLRNSQSVAEQNLAGNFKRKEDYYCLVQILKNDHEPDLVGKIKIFRFGQKINNILQGELQPEYGKSYNPFDLFTGRIFSLTVTLVAGFNNFDTSKFVGEESPVQFNEKTLTKDPKVMKEFVEYLKENSPDLKICKYKEWTDETREKVKNIIRNTVPSMRNVESMKVEINEPASKTKKAPIKSETISTTPTPPTPSIDEEKLELDINEIDIDIESSSFDEELFAGL